MDVYVREKKRISDTQVSAVLHLCLTETFLRHAKKYMNVMQVTAMSSCALLYHRLHTQAHIHIHTTRTQGSEETKCKVVEGKTPVSVSGME